MLSGAGVLVVGRYIVAALSWGVTLIVVRELSVSDFGRYQLIFSLLAIVGFIADLRLSRIVLRDVMEVEGAAAGEIIGSYLGMRLVIGVVSYGAAMAWVLIGGYPHTVVIGTAIAFLGVVLIGIGTGGSVLGGGVGVLWALLAALTYAAGVLFQKPVLARLPNAQVVWLGCVIGMLVCTPFTGELIADVQSAPIEGLLGMIWLGAVPTALGYTTWSYALARMPAGQLGVSTYIVPPVTILLSLALFGEVPPVLAIVGGVIALLGVALSRRMPTPDPAEVPVSRPPEPAGRSRE